MEKYEVFNTELSTIENDDIREFAKFLLNNAPDYFYEAPASSSGLFHPDYTLGEGGLVRHTKAVVGFLNHFLNLEQYNSMFDSVERDCMRVACLLHDSEKSGRDGGKKTVSEHPALASETVINNCGNFVSDKEAKFIADCIESHMGQWNTNKRMSFALPKPTTEAQKLVHLADYLASRKDITVDVGSIPEVEIPDLNDYKLTFGKYKGEFLVEVAGNDPSYISWLKENVFKEPVKTLLSKI